MVAICVDMAFLGAIHTPSLWSSAALWDVFRSCAEYLIAKTLTVCVSEEASLGDAPDVLAVL